MEKYFQWQHWRVRHLKLFQAAAASRGEYNIKRLHLLKTLPLISNTALRLRNTIPLRGSNFHDTFPGLNTYAEFNDYKSIVFILTYYGYMKYNPGMPQIITHNNGMGEPKLRMM